MIELKYLLIFLSLNAIFRVQEDAMEIYFAASIAGGRQYLPTYQKMVHYLQQAGHRVLTEHIIAPDVWHLEEQLTPQQVYTRDIEWLTGADALIAEVSNPSLGVGYEISYALSLLKPVLCLYHESVMLSRMISGNTRPGILVYSYQSDVDWQSVMDHFLHKS
jgi:2'-deoxynucleoside 5'-phosphate N-hydrolase